MRTVVALLLTVLTAPAVARAQAQHTPSAMSSEVKAHWARGLADHAAGRYEAASAAFEACYQLDPRRECLFAWAQASRLAGDCARAVPLYRQYLQVAGSARQRDAAQTQLEACEATLAASTPNVVAEHTTAEPSAPPPAASQHRSPWYLDLWGDVLVGAGGVALAGGTLMYVSSGRDVASSAPTYGAYAARLDGAKRTRSISLVALSAGSMLVAAGVLHMVLRTDTHATPGIGVSVDGTQLGLHVQRAF